jgi:hypothetical protein
MHSRFLREEAARFRGMAETQDREASKVRLLKMAADYEAQADAKDGELAAEKSAEGIGAKVRKKIAKEPGEPLDATTAGT